MGEIWGRLSDLAASWPEIWPTADHVTWTAEPLCLSGANHARASSCRLTHLPHLQLSAQRHYLSSILHHPLRRRHHASIPPRWRTTPDTNQCLHRSAIALKSQATLKRRMYASSRVLEFVLMCDRPSYQAEPAVGEARTEDDNLPDDFKVVKRSRNTHMRLALTTPPHSSVAASRKPRYRFGWGSFARCIQFLLYVIQEKWPIRGQVLILNFLHRSSSSSRPPLALSPSSANPIRHGYNQTHG